MTNALHNVVVIGIPAALWARIEAALTAERRPLLRRARDAARDAGLTAGDAHARPWERLRARGNVCVTVGMGEEPAEARPADAAAALALCEALLDARRPDFAYVRLDAPVDADTLETWLGRIDAKLGSGGACYVCVGDTPPGDDAVAALFAPRETGLSEEDAAALRDRLMGLGYL